MSRRASELRELTRMRLLLFTREPEAIFWVFLFPIALALVLSLAFRSRGVETVRIGAVEGSLARPWADALGATEGIDFVMYATLEEAQL